MKKFTIVPGADIESLRPVEAALRVFDGLVVWLRQMAELTGISL